MSVKLDALLSFYTKQLLDVGAFDSDNSGMMSYLKKGKPEPITVSKTRLVLPTLKFIRDGDWSERTAFHPLAEQISEGPSPILNAFKSYVELRLKDTAKAIIEELAKLAEDTKRQKSMSAKASAFLAGLVDFDQKGVDKVIKVLDNVATAPDRRLISLFLQNKTDDGSLRATKVSFPIMADAESKDLEEFFGVNKLRKTKDKAWIVALLTYVLGDEETRNGFSVGSKNTNSPYYHSLLLSFRKLAEHFNGLIDLHSPSCPNLTAFRFNLDWTDELDDFQNFAKQNGVSVPALPGNTGVEIDSVFEASAEDVGGDPDLPWNETPAEKAARIDNREPRTPRGDREDERRSPTRDEPRRTESTGGKQSLKDLLGRGKREEARDARRPGRDDRNDRGGRGGRGGVRF